MPLAFNWNCWLTVFLFSQVGKREKEMNYEKEKEEIVAKLEDHKFLEVAGPIFHSLGFGDFFPLLKISFNERLITVGGRAWWRNGIWGPITSLHIEFNPAYWAIAGKDGRVRTFFHELSHILAYLTYFKKTGRIRAGHCSVWKRYFYSYASLFGFSSKTRHSVSRYSLRAEKKRQKKERIMNIATILADQSSE